MEMGRTDFLGQYKAISNKLKKRFLRKPNVAEASEQFSLLASELQQQGCPHYAAFCCLAIARCEETLSNSNGTTQALVQAARLFLEAENQNHSLLCPGFNEHLTSAISCFSHAIRIHLQNNQTSHAASLCIEMARALKNLNKISEAISYFQKAAELQSFSPFDYITTLQEISECKILQGDFNGALELLTEASIIAEDKGDLNGDKPIGVFSSLVATFEVTRVLLLLILQPKPHKLRQEHIQILEKYTWDFNEIETSTYYLSEDLILLLQSLILAGQQHDVESLKVLQKELSPYFTPLQNHLLHKVISSLAEAYA